MTKEKLEIALYNAIMLLRDHMPDCCWIDSEEFVSLVCVAIDITEEDYRKIMRLDEDRSE